VKRFNPALAAPGPAATEVRARLRLVHLSDTGQSIYRHDAVGLGDVNFSAAVQKIKTLGLERAPMLEIISRDQRSRYRSID
jgi:sugar phosphate isomerase/epimerase